MVWSKGTTSGMKERAYVWAMEGTNLSQMLHWSIGGQIHRIMTWIRKHLASGTHRAIDEKFRYTCLPIPKTRSISLMDEFSGRGTGGE